MCLKYLNYLNLLNHIYLLIFYYFHSNYYRNLDYVLLFLVLPLWSI